MGDSVNAQVPAKDTSFSQLKWLGVTVGSQEYVTDSQGLRAAQQNCGPWRHSGSLNPPQLSDVVQSLLPDMHVVFVVERDINRNVVVYAVNDTGKGVDTTQPMSVFWLMIPAAKSDTDLGEVYTEDLTRVEANLAYGVSRAQVHSPTKFTVNVRAVNGEPIVVQKQGGKWQAFIHMNGDALAVKRFMIFTEARRWLAWPKSVEMHVDTVPVNSQPVTYHFEVP